MLLFKLFERKTKFCLFPKDLEFEMNLPRAVFEKYVEKV